MEVEVVDYGNFEKVLPLISEYQRFYGADSHTEKNRDFFAGLLTSHEWGVQFVALENGNAIGFATLYFPLSTLSASRSCVLNDLYTVKEYRGLGVGRTLLSHCSAYARLRGFPKMEWQTQEKNRSAQRLYNRLPAQQSKWLSYELSLVAEYN